MKIRNSNNAFAQHHFIHKSGAGFTLIELLIVVGIVAILATAVVMVINPSEMVKQTRDSKRLSDLGTINKALGIYQVEKTSFGSSSVVYVSIPDSSASCANLGLPTLPSGWSYACVSSSTLTNINGTGWIPVDFTSLSYGATIEKLLVDPINTTSSYNYYTYIPGGSWKLQATLESDKYQTKARNDGGTTSGVYELGTNLTLASTIFPSYWEKVPGNSTFGTSDFYVMKYEAKCVQASNNTPLTSPNTGYNTYSNSGQPCTGSSYYIASAPDGYPIANISHNTALSYCASLGAHLLRNDEWMTIATNAANVSSNWKNGVVGSAESAGGMYRGNSNSSLAMDGTNPLSGTNTRTWTLSNGSVIWDIAGNVWEHVQRSANNAGDLTTTITTPTCSSGTGWCEYAGAGAHITAWNDASFSAATVGPPNGSWYSAQGIGKVYPASGGASGSVFLRGGRWGSGTDAGAFTLYLGWGAGTAGNDVVFRCAR